MPVSLKHTQRRVMRFVLSVGEIFCSYQKPQKKNHFLQMRTRQILINYYLEKAAVLPRNRSFPQHR